MSISDRFRRLYARRNEKALFGFFIDSEYPLYRYPRIAQRLPIGRALRPEDFDIRAFVADSEELYLKHQRCGGDFIYSGSAYWGIPWIEALCGLPIYVGSAGAIEVGRPEDGFEAVHFDADNEWAQLAARMLCELAENSKGRYPLSSTRTRGVADMLQAFLGAEAMVYAMLDEADRVHELAARFTEVIMGFWRFQQRFIPEWQGGQGSFYYHMWVPRATFWHQEDAASVLSPTLFEEFIMPEDRRLAECGNVIIHQHPTPSLPFEQHLSVGYMALELHVDEGNVDSDRMQSMRKFMLERAPLLIWGRLNADEMTRIRALPQRGLAVQAVVDDVESAWALLEEWRHG